MDIYGNKLVNMIEIKPLCRSRWVSLTNLGCAGMLRFALLYLKNGDQTFECILIKLDACTP